MIDDGIKYTNLRQIVRDHMRENRMECRCIRCREWGHNIPREKRKKEENIAIEVAEYAASQGTELFLTATGRATGLLHAYLRLRFISEGDGLVEQAAGRNAAVVRELKVVGPAVPLGTTDKSSIQHTGLGSMLLDRGERIAREAGRELMLITAGTGVREYYRKRGYRRDGPYMAKKL